MANRIEPMSSPECCAAIAAHRKGRIVTTSRALPFAAPVLYEYRWGAVWFFVQAASGLSRSCPGHVVALEIDEIDDETGGWSVVAVGRTDEEHDPETIARLRSGGLGAIGEPDELVRLTIGQVSGVRWGTDPSDRAAPRSPLVER